MAALLALGFVLVHFADRGAKKVSKDDAVAIARTKIDFKPTGYQIRFLQARGPAARVLGDLSLHTKGERASTSQ